jgi:polar amino acid transport system ATP-binding protein
MGFARDFSHRVMMFDGGQVIEDAPPGKLFSEPDHPRTQAFPKTVLDRG